MSRRAFGSRGFNHFLLARIALLCCFLCACHKASTFRFAPTGNGSVLVPPGVENASVSHALLPIHLGKSQADCAPSPHGLRIGRKKVEVDRGALLSMPSEELFSWTAALEEVGCIPSGTANLLEYRIIDSVPLDAAKRRELANTQLSQMAQTGFVDLGFAHSLRVVSPITATGVATSAGEIKSVSQGRNGNLAIEVQSNPAVTGYEVAWYDLNPLPSGYGFRIAARSAETHSNGTVEQNTTPRINYFRFGPGQRLYRFFVVTRSSANDYDAVLISAKNAPELDQFTAQFRRDATAFLKAAEPDTYAAIPHGVGVNPYVICAVNGERREFVFGSAVRQAIGTDYSPELLTRLRIRKLHGGKFAFVEWDRKTDAILSLPLEGGEEITW